MQEPIESMRAGYVHDPGLPVRAPMRPRNLASYLLRALSEAESTKSRRDDKLVMYTMTESGPALIGTLPGRSEIAS